MWEGKVKSKILLVLAFITLTGCPKRAEVRAEMWLQSGLPADLCAKNPEIRQYGMYRRLNDDVCEKAGKKIPCYELQRYCNAEAKKYLAIEEQRFNDLLDAYLPKE
jgi:hypothetical protein